MYPTNIIDNYVLLLCRRKESFDVNTTEDFEYDGGNILKYLKSNINNNDLNPVQQQVVLNSYFPNELLVESEKKKKKRLFAPNSSANTAGNASRKRKQINDDEDEDHTASSTVALDVETVKKFVNAVDNDEEGGRKRSRSVGSNAGDDADSGDDDTVEDASVGDDDYGVNYYESDNGSGGDDDDGGAY